MQNGYECVQRQRRARLSTVNPSLLTTVNRNAAATRSASTCVRKAARWHPSRRWERSILRLTGICTIECISHCGLAAQLVLERLPEQLARFYVGQGTIAPIPNLAPPNLWLHQQVVVVKPANSYTGRLKKSAFLSSPIFSSRTAPSEQTYVSPRSDRFISVIGACFETTEFDTGVFLCTLWSLVAF